MRKRNKEIILWLTEEEYAQLKERVAKTPLTMQAYLRNVIRNIQPRERVQLDLVEVLKILQRLGTNMNQIAFTANSLNFVDTAAYWENVESLKSAMRELREVIYR